DIPGLIEGAHEGTGLGHEFLRHIERTRLLVHVLDISGFEGRQPLEDFYKINEELEKYNSKLKDKPQIVAANKIDITGAKENYNIIKNELEEKGIKVYPISAATYEGIDNLKYAMWNKLKEIEKDYSTFDDEIDLSDLKEDKEQIIVKKEDGKYIVEGEFIEKLLYSTNFDSYDSLRYFQDTIRRKGIVEELKKMGVEEKDLVYICGYEFEFFE